MLTDLSRFLTILKYETNKIPHLALITHITRNIPWTDRKRKSAESWVYHICCFCFLALSSLVWRKCAINTLCSYKNLCQNHKEAVGFRQIALCSLYTTLYTPKWYSRSSLLTKWTPVFQSSLSMLVVFGHVLFSHFFWSQLSFRVQILTPPPPQQIKLSFTRARVCDIDITHFSCCDCTVHCTASHDSALKCLKRRKTSRYWSYIPYSKFLFLQKDGLDSRTCSLSVVVYLEASHQPYTRDCSLFAIE